MTTLPHTSEHASDEHHHGPWFLGHHWNSANQQFEAGKLGMWLFLATEILFFGGLFCAYAVWRGNHPELFRYGSQFLDTTLGATNTAVLILSSLTMAWAVTSAQKGNQFMLKLCLWLTLAGACGFLVIKYFEYTHKFHEGWFPGMKFYDQPGAQSHTWEASLGGAHGDVELHAAEAGGALGGTLDIRPGLPAAEPSSVLPAASGPAGLSGEADLSYAETATADSHDDDHEAHLTHPLLDPARPSSAHMFFNIYFMMTGLHGIHVAVGIIVISWLLINSYRGLYGPAYFTQVDLGGLYWHVVDLIWIFLFPLFYLI